MLYGLAMETPLTLSLIMQHAKKLYARREIVSYSKDRGLFQYTYGDAFSRVAQLAHALQGLGVTTSERIATLAHNDFRHFELYFATACSGAVCHTINPRLFDQQIEYIINHAENRWVFVDPDFVPLLEKLQHQLPNILGYIVLCDPDHMPQTDLKNTHCYETLIQHQPKQYDWPELDERLACGICYTSGTTGNPKGVLYSHRSTTLATLSCLPASSWHIQESDVVLASVPMYHANAWNLPYAGALTGAKLVLPGPRLGNGEYDQQLIQRYGVTVTAGVPTVALSLLTYLRKSGKTVDSLTRMVVGGSACPQTMMEEFERDYGVFIHHAWGMTELNPLGSMNHLLPSQDPSNSWRQRRSVGRPVFGVDIKIVDASDNELPWDDTVSGLLKVRGPWVCNEYYKLGKTDANGDDGWFETGDMATIDPDGNFTITDRVKDVIKSGGEWISSIEVENVAVQHPAIKEAAVIGITDEKWGERPLLCVVPEPGADPSQSEIISWFSGKIAKWWIPQYCEFLPELPYTATGKVSKKDLRELFSRSQETSS